MNRWGAKHRDEEHELLLRRSSVCEMLAQVLRDVDVKARCAQLAIEYRILANRLKQLDFMQDKLH